MKQCAFDVKCSEPFRPGTGVQTARYNTTTKWAMIEDSLIYKVEFFTIHKINDISLNYRLYSTNLIHRNVYFSSIYFIFEK